MWALVISACSRDRSVRTDAAAEASLIRDSALRVGAAASDQTTHPPPNSDSLHAAIAAAEESLRVHGDDPAFADLYLRLGRIKKTYEGRLSYASPRATYARMHPDQYRPNEVAADYLYNGYHFRELVRRFPQSQWADDAAWEVTLLPQGGECEGYIPCYIAREFDLVAEFLRGYPGSPFVPEAVRRANEAFTSALADVVDLTAPSDDYPPGKVQELLARYDTIAEHLPLEVRAQATLMSADLWSRFLNRERARALYGWLLAAHVPGVDTSDVRLRLNALTGETFVLRPAVIVSDRRVELSWDAPTEKAIRGYVLTRSSGRDSAGQPIAELGAEARSYSDQTARAAGNYWYRVRARTASREIASNPVHVATPAAALNTAALVFTPRERMLYVFGYLENGFPRVLQVSERGEVVTAHDGALYGLERYASSAHRFDLYVPEAWFVDAASQAFLRFQKTQNAFGADLGSAIRAGASAVAVDTSGMPYYGIRVSVNPAQRRMWIAPRGQVYAFAWDDKRDVAWEGREGSVRQTDPGGKTIREIALPSSRTNENEFVTAIWADSRTGSAWAYLSRKGGLVRIDSSGAITQSLPLERYIGDEPRWIAFDFAHGWVWAVTGAVTDRRLVQFAIADGRLLRSSRLAGVVGFPYLAPDTVTGRLWLLHANRLANFDSTGALLFQTTVPTKR